MMNIAKLKGKIVENGLSQHACAKAIGMSKNTFNSRVNGKSQFNLDEISRLCSLLNINDVEEKVNIFLPNSSQ